MTDGPVTENPDLAPQPCFRRPTNAPTCAQHGQPWVGNGCAANPYADGGPVGTGDWPEIQTFGAPPSAISDTRTMAQKLKSEVHYLHAGTEADDFDGMAAACDHDAGLTTVPRPMTFVVNDPAEVTCGPCRTHIAAIAARSRCYLCGDVNDHGGYPHGEVTGDYRVRADVNPCEGADFGCQLGEGHDGPHQHPEVDG